MKKLQSPFKSGSVTDNRNAVQSQKFANSVNSELATINSNMGKYESTVDPADWSGEVPETLSEAINRIVAHVGPIPV